MQNCVCGIDKLEHLGKESNLRNTCKLSFFYDYNCIYINSLNTYIFVQYLLIYLEDPENNSFSIVCGRGKSTCNSFSSHGPNSRTYTVWLCSFSSNSNACTDCRKKHQKSV